MKKLNITKKQFSESKYFQTKYGKLKYVSESGNVYKTDKGNVLRFNEEYEFDESYIGDMVKDGWKKVKDGARKLKTKIGDMFNGPFRRGERVEMSGENGETVKGTIMGFDLEDKTYTVLLGRDEY